MSQHPPKLYALEALENGRLSKAGERRIEAHLLSCAACAHARESVRTYRDMLEAARDEATPELSWQKFEAKLERDERKAEPRKWLALAVPALAIAATFAIAWVGLSGQKRQNELAQRPVSQEVEAPSVPVEPVVSLRGAVTAMAGTPEVGETAASLASQVREGEVLRTSANEVLHLRLVAGTGIVLWEESELRVARLRENEVVLELVRGGVSNQVAKLASSAHYEVRAGDITASVRGTRFAVTRQADATAVTVHEGIVAVSRGDVELALLHAGQSFSTGEHAPLAERAILAFGADAQTWPALTLPQLPSVRAWTVSDAGFSGLGEVAMRAPPGELTIDFEDSQGISHKLTQVIPAEGARLSEEDISRVIERDRENRLGTLDPQLITPVVRSGLDGLKRCYEQSLRRVPNLAGKLTLSLRVSSTGQVVRTRLGGQTGEAVDAGLQACITGKAATWAFPAPTGGPVNIDLPLNLKSNSP